MKSEDQSDMKRRYVSSVAKNSSPVKQCPVKSASTKAFEATPVKADRHIKPPVPRFGRRKKGEEHPQTEPTERAEKYSMQTPIDDIRLALVADGIKQ